MKRTIRTIILAGLAAVCFQSCLFEQEDIFDEASSNRLANVMKEAKAALESSEYGWLFEIYPGGSQQYGGYAFTCKFSELEVEVMTELAEDYTEPATSYYKMTNDNGPVLTFDTYNDYIHYFATPWASSSGYQAYQGEFEFVVEKIESDLITLRGSRTGNRLYLRKLTEPAVDYIAKVVNTTDNLIMSELVGQIGTSNVDIDFDVDDRAVTVYDKVTEEELASSAFAVTDKGIRLYDTLAVGGQNILSMTLAEDGQSFTCDGVAGSTLDAVFPEGWRAFEDYAGNYTLHYEQSATLLRDVTVTLTPRADKSGYDMSGLNSNYTVFLKYVKASGTLKWNSQIVATLSTGNNVWLCAWTVDGGGTLTWSTDAGMETLWNGDEENPVYTLVDNGDSSYKIDSFTLWQLTSGNSSVGEYNLTAWRVIGSTSTRIRYAKSLTKID